jgi:inositol polyphosphate-4-phosphatase
MNHVIVIYNNHTGLGLQVTALICGFEAKVYTSLFDTSFMKQLCQIGVLAEFECLLSTYGMLN